MNSLTDTDRTVRQGTPHQGSPDAAARGTFLGRLAGLAVVAVLIGLALGRFAFFEPPRVVGPPMAPTLAAPADVAGLEQAVERNPSDVASWQALGVAYTRRAAETADPSFYDLAGRAFDRADALAPADPQTALGRGVLALSLHDFTAALALGERSLRALPGSPDALGVIVDAQVELGRYTEAAESLQRMLDARPALPALARTSYLRELNGDLPGALQAMQQAEATDSGTPFDRAGVSALLGDLYLKRADLDRAEDAYARAQLLVPDLAAAAVGRARVAAARGDRAEAIEILSGLVERVPYPVAVGLLGELQTLEGRRDEAAATDELGRAMAQLQAQAGVGVNLETALFEADRGAGGSAVELARRAYDERPDNVFAADALGWALLRDGDAQGAARYAGRAVRLDTADGLVRYHAAAAFERAGDRVRARSELVKAFRQPWFSFRLQPEARALAGRLGVRPPVAWQER